MYRRGERCSPYDGHLPDAPTIETIVPVTFYEIINFQSTVIGRFITEAGAFAAINGEPFEPAEDFAEEIEAG